MRSWLNDLPDWLRDVLQMATWFVGGLALAGLAVWLIVWILPEDYFRVRFTEFYTCAGPDPTTGLPLERVTTWPTHAEEITACGRLETRGLRHLQFVLVYEDQKPAAWSTLGDYEAGYVFEAIPASQLRPGHYRVEVHAGRSKLASTEFVIVDETDP